jgi:rubrerythrin
MKTPKFDSESVGKWLSKLTDVELVDFFYAHMRDRNIYRAEGRHRQSHLVLAVSSRDVEDNGEAEPWRLQLLAPANETWAADSPICQFGACAVCGHATASVSKDAQCPVCLNPVRGG